MPQPKKPHSLFRYFNSSPEVIRLVVMMYVRSPLSLRKVKDLLFERGIDISLETVRHWWNRFGPLFAADIRRQRVSRMRGFKQWRWHIDEMYVRLNGEMVYLWRAVDHEGEILESYVTKTRDKAAALRFMKKALKRHGSPEAITTDGLRSYGAAMDELGNREKQEVGRSGGVEAPLKEASVSEVTTIGLDIAKSVFHVHGADERGAMLFSRKLTRGKLLEFFAGQPRCIVALEACGGAHHWGRQLQEMGYTVRLIPPAYVKPFVKRHKNDAIDAEAICEAAQRPGMRFVAVKTEAQQAGRAGVPHA
jgi:putative transposase